MRPVRPRLAAALLAGALLAGAPPAGGQPRDRAARVGVLNLGATAGTAASPSAARLFPALVEGLREHGWVEGKNLVLDWRSADWQPERLPGLAAGLVAGGVDVIVVSGPAPLEAARAATATIPIVMVASAIDPVAEGLVQGLARPGGNVTGLAVGVSPELAGKQLELVKEAVPGVTRVRLVWDVDLQRVGAFTRAFEAAGPRLGLEVQPTTRIAHHRFIDQLFADLVKSRTQAVMFGMGGVLYAHRAVVARLALQHKLATFGSFRELPEAGGLLSYGPDLRDLYRRAGGYVDKLLRGAKAAELPVELPSRFELVVNLGTAKALGLTLPDTVLARADDVIR
jgi:putative ABC transport system substrate-binding protein